MYELTARELIRLVPFTLKTKRVPFIKGSPAIGKSAVAKLIAKQYNLKLIDERLSTSEPTDLKGMPNTQGTYSIYKPFEEFPIKGTPLPSKEDGTLYDGWLLFLDELNTIDKPMEAAAYKLILDRMVGQNPLHEKVRVIAAGNLATDRAIVKKFSTASQSRLIHYHMKFHYGDFMEDVVYGMKWDIRLAAYLSWKPNRAYDFKPSHENDTYSSPRTWEFVQDHLEAWGPDPLEDWFVPALAGCVEKLHAEEFYTFTKVFTQIPDIKVIINDPMGAPLPQQADLKFATVVSLVEHVTEENLDQIMRYIERITGMEFMTTFMRMTLARHPNTIQHPAIIRNMVALIRK